MTEQRFSDRVGATQPPASLAIGVLPDRIRNTLWNWICEVIPHDTTHTSYWKTFVQELYRNFFKLPVDAVPIYNSLATSALREWFFDGARHWYEPYNLIDHMLPRLYTYGAGHSENVIRQLNVLLERELSGYRVVDKVLVPLTNATEVAAIEDAMRARGSASVPAQHIRKALHLLGAKPNPDYPNSVKESISAVEGVVKAINGTKGGGLEGALKTLADALKLHPAMVKGMLSLYGYTSDAHGIRHPMTESATVSFDDAKYMLVACSAFVNFLIARASVAGLVKGSELA